MRNVKILFRHMAVSQESSTETRSSVAQSEVRKRVFLSTWNIRRTSVNALHSISACGMCYRAPGVSVVLKLRKAHSFRDLMAELVSAGENVLLMIFEFQYCLDNLPSNLCNYTIRNATTSHILFAHCTKKIYGVGEKERDWDGKLMGVGVWGLSLSQARNRQDLSITH